MDYLFCHNLLYISFVILSFLKLTLCAREYVWAVNCGGDEHLDANGIRYARDTLTTGIASDFGRSMIINRVHRDDQILYQTERYHTATFGYDIPVKDDGDHVLVLKFSEVWFTSPNQKVFDVLLNGEHIVADSLDIFSRVGRATAEDLVIPLNIKNKELRVNGEKSILESGQLTVEFIKGERDNPKVNAILLMKGTIQDVPMLPPLPGLDRNLNADDEDEEEDSEEDLIKPRNRPPNPPKVQDPYAADDTGSMMLPVFAAIGAFIPLLFCLCKL